jgi:NhaA family Na+:H+ antiporter
MVNQKQNPATELEKRVAWILSPFQSFVRDTRIGSVIFLGSVLIALAIANSPGARAYHQLLETKASINVGGWEVEGSLHHWVNDGLMVLLNLPDA